MSPSRPLPFSRRARGPRDAGDSTVPAHPSPRERLRGLLGRPVELAERIEHASALDDAAAGLTRSVREALRRSGSANVLHGVPLGQPAHPPLVRVPLGCWASAALLDLLPGTSKASGALIAAGIAGTVPAAAAGLADWSALHREQQRVGLVHAASGATATALFSASLLARAAGRHRSGKLLSIGGLTIAGAGGYLGGHLAFRLGAGASHAEPVAHLAPLGWHDLCRIRDLPDGKPVRKTLGYLSLLVLRQGTEVRALADHCAHLGGPLHQGRVIAVGRLSGQESRAVGRLSGQASGADDICIVCPWHGSTFRMSDGTVVNGPATARQPAFDTQVTPSGMLQVKPKI